MCFQLMSMQFEVYYSVTVPAGILAAVYNVTSEEVVAVGVGFCAVCV